MKRILFLLVGGLPCAFACEAGAETVHIPGPAGKLEAEAVSVPDARHVLVIVPGSGPTDRNGNSSLPGLASNAYRFLAEDLAARGVASLRIDKRGFFGSAGALADANDVTIEAYAEDARRWVDRAAGLAPCVWIAGHSEGGLVALVAAQKPPESLCGLILISTSGRPTGQLLIEQLQANPANAPLMPEIKSVVDDLEAGRPRDPESLSPVLQSFFSRGLQRYMIDLFSYDPAIIADAWKGSVLIVQGDADMQVKLQDAELLAKSMPQAQRVDLAGGTHMLKEEVPGNPMATYSDPSLPLHPQLVPAIVNFLEAADRSR
ncbi:alpha/beta hydrolase [Nitratireductor indicus]|uniref:alpha/beta hydrolase n=1 Tax=Nitratireductor indicus TaxID=721133 RepID=UPI0028758C36|nr:alpha/beta fold hydrolase [Nitratireductor indicus]MDS1136614.1 alpha/beta fold hydrolase [Nitratireductor indicus]